METRSYWGYGAEEHAASDDERAFVRAMLAARFGGSPPAEIDPPSLDALDMPKPRVAPPSSLAHVMKVDARERAAHTYGKAYRDIVRGLAGDYRAAPDMVALPESEEDVARVLDHCASHAIAAIPFGGGSSVVGGVEARLDRDRYRGVVSIDLRRLDRVIEIDKTSRAARIQAGIFGPALERALAEHDLTLRHYPQSFESSTLGGWIATRAGGHFATLHTHIDDFVEAVRVVTPSGIFATRRLPGSGAGPAPERLVIGSEGALGVITEAWMRLQDKPVFRASATARFDDFMKGAEAARLLAQSGLHPSNCRLIDASEAQLTGAGDGSSSLLLVAFESHDHGLDAWMDRALEICRGAGGAVKEGAGRTKSGDDAAGAWRRTFLRAPYLRDAMLRAGAIAETFETAITWDRFEGFVTEVSAAARRGAERACGAAFVSCRLTHVYPDGAAPYFTVIAPAPLESGPLDRVRVWDAIKVEVSEAIVRLGGTITHHHAVGRDHRPFYDRERSPLFGDALRAVKRALDPAGVLNPGVLVDV